MTEETTQPVEATEPETIEDFRVRVHSKDLLLAISRVQKSLADDEARPILTYILIEGTETGLRFVAADNYRISVQEITGAHDGGDFAAWPPSLLRKDDLPTVVAWLKSLGRNGGEVVIGVPEHAKTEDPSLAFAGPYGAISVRQGWGKYPDWRMVGIEPEEGQKPSVVVNPRLIAELASVLRHETILRVYISDPLKPVILRGPEGFTQVIMPLRLP